MMPSASTSRENEKELNQLRDILLKDDRDEVSRIRQLIEEKDKLSYHVAPIIQEHIEFLKENYPDEFRKVVDKQIESKLKASKDELISVIYPAVGQMIRKYVAHQILLLRESIEDRIEEVKSGGPIGWIRRNIFGVKDGDWVLSQVISTQIESVFVIEKDSGLLLGSASVSETTDEDLLAGMLTAIKGFAEDAFMKESQQVDSIEYENLTIFLKSFPKFYIAVSLDGKLTNADKDKLSSRLLVFVNKKLNRVLIRNYPNKELEINRNLNTYFFTVQKLPSAE